MTIQVIEVLGAVVPAPREEPALPLTTPLYPGCVVMGKCNGCNGSGWVRSITGRKVPCPYCRR